MQQIEELIERGLTENIFGENFSFRRGQRETITSIINAYQNDPEGSVIIDAPTGTGKSIIAMWCTWILKEMGKQGYLVTSDLSLQDQYEHDFYKFNLRWPSIRGIDNYECHMNGLPFSLGECKMRGMSYSQALEKLPCAATCEYLQTRKRAIEQPVALVNYSFWLIQRNFVAKKMIAREAPVPFEKRDFIFFDEAHQIDQIVQSHFSPFIKDNLHETIKEIQKFLSKNSLDYPEVTSRVIYETIQDLLNVTDKEVLFLKLKHLKKFLVNYLKTKGDVDKLSKKRYRNLESQMPQSWKNVFSKYDFIKDVHCKIEDYIEIIKDEGIDTMVVDQGEDYVKFMCINESKMIQKYLHQQAGFKVFMSATIGSPQNFARIMGIEKAKLIRLDNQFSYEKSPIVFFNKYKLSYREREKNFESVAKILDKIIERHKGQRGIIHTGSYLFSSKIIERSKYKNRLIKYTESKYKKTAIEAFKSNPGSILIGPSILEGLDLRDDTSRFQVFFKVPYPSLSDPLIKEKLKVQPTWYNWKTTISLLQGVGRSVRNENDWATTYILDACFESLLLTPGAFPKTFIDRIKIVE